MSEAVSRRSTIRWLSRLGGLGALAGATAASLLATTGCAPPVPPTVRRTGAPSPAAAPRPAATGRIDTLLARLTLDEKTALLHGAPDPAPRGRGGYLPGVPRLGIPALRVADGPAGVRVDRPATVLPAPLLLACAFDPALAREYGRVLGREGRALGQDVLLAPVADLARSPYAGRASETFGEDPRLTADLVAAVVRGIQDEGLISAVGHFALGGRAPGRAALDVSVSDRALHETELRGFEAAVTAGAGVVVGSGNRLDGTYACEDRALLDEVLRGRWGFDGWVMSDRDATHSTVAAIAAGLDVEMPGGTHYGAPLRAAVRAGSVSPATLDLAVRRILTTLDRFGLLSPRPPARPAPEPGAGARLARQVAVAGAVLLHNVRATLPLTGAEARSVAVIGPAALHEGAAGAGAASPLSEIRRRVGAAGEVRHAVGEDVHGRPLPPGLLTPPVETAERKVDAGRDWNYAGTFTLAAADEWTLLVHHTGARPSVRLDGQELFPAAPAAGAAPGGGLLDRAPDGMRVSRRTLALTAGAHRITVSARGGSAGQRLRLRHITGASRAADRADAVAVAEAARSVVLFAHEDPGDGGERATLGLPGGQAALIEAVTAVNPRTTVVLNTPSSTTMPWLAGTGAVLQMYHPGQEGAGATADLLFGDADPGGRLAQTYPADERARPTGADPRRRPATGVRREYAEGVHVGHRWYDARGVAPLFPFGHGLSYTTWAYGELDVGARRGGLRVEFTVRNTGRRKGVEVAQVYLGPSPDLALEQPVRVLVGYRRLTLEPGSEQRVTVDVDARALSCWDAERQAWVPGSGRREVFVGRSSRELPLRAKTVVRSG
ncbi:glycoside hydrolase family 3 N-terminal domain-containing protein [Streptomyces sp. NPDC048606]|uniref:beta-glucosidase family protein n=1 Tax=Streptomyces sp. NPDC048606 TaxID=3154726 RepID=UPI0034452D81